MRKGIATILILTTINTIGGYTLYQDQADERSFSLIEYIETHDIDSYSDFIDVINTNTSYSYDEIDISDVEIDSFNIEIDYDTHLVEVLVVSHTATRATGAHGEASKDYYSDAGTKVFTVNVSGDFSYSTGFCNVTSSSGSFTKPSYSTWTSSPTITSGHITTTKAYVRIYGIARTIGNSKSYTLTLTCDDSGNFSSY